MPHEPDIYDSDNLHCECCGAEIDEGEDYYIDVEGMTLCQACFDDWVWEHKRRD